MWFEWNENENENDVLDLPSLEIVAFRKSSFQNCHVAVFESMWWLSIFISFLILDLPKLQIISFNGSYAIVGDGGDNRKTIINGHESFDNTLIMKSMWIEIKCELCCYYNFLDLPSLTSITTSGRCWYISKHMGHVTLESKLKHKTNYIIWIIAKTFLIFR